MRIHARKLYVRWLIAHVAGERPDTDDFAKFARHGEQLVLGVVGRQTIDVNVWRS